jgi:hypothetical protein
VKRPQLIGSTLAPPADRTQASSAAGSACHNGFPAVLKALGTVPAPASVATGLLFYFGAQHAYWFCAYFGVHYTALEFTTPDYLIRSADGLFVPVATAALTGLAKEAAVRWSDCWRPDWPDGLASLAAIESRQARSADRWCEVFQRVTVARGGYAGDAG